jgi:hypothetical protein
MLMTESLTFAYTYTHVKEQYVYVLESNRKKEDRTTKRTTQG